MGFEGGDGFEGFEGFFGFEGLVGFEGNNGFEGLCGAGWIPGMCVFVGNAFFLVCLFYLDLGISSTYIMDKSSTISSTWTSDKIEKSGGH